jgi:ComF family protein
VLVPVPLHRSRLFHRRYNQAALLARAVGRIAGRPYVPDALLRLRATESLGEKSAEERATEVAGAFAIRRSRSSRMAGKNVLLVDDVMTSGATANACAMALLAAGVTSVDVLVAARVPDPRLMG